MKQKLLLFITLFCFLSSTAQYTFHPPRDAHDSVSCDAPLTDSAYNLIVNPGFRSTGDSLEDFSDGDVFMWQDVNNLTTDINGALADSMGWTLPTVPPILTGTNFASMFIDNGKELTEGISGRIFPLENGKKYALSFFLSSSAMSGYRTYGGTYTFKIFLINCQNFGVSTSGNPEITDESQLVYCRVFENMGDSDWQQYLVNFTANADYNMIVIYPEISNSRYNGGTYLHFLYPELIPINPTNQYSTYFVPGWIDTTNINNPIVHPDSTHGITLLSACGVTNASYQWTGPNGVVSEEQTAILPFSNTIGEDDVYSFSMWVDGAIGNRLVNCGDAGPPLISETANQIPTTPQLTCGPVVGTNNCNIIPNATFDNSGISNIGAFSSGTVQPWSSINTGSPDANSPGQSGQPIYIPPAYPSQVPPAANAAGMGIEVLNDDIGAYTNYEGIYTGIPRLDIGRTYVLSFFLNIKKYPSINSTDFNFFISLGNCNGIPPANNPSDPPNLGIHQDIFCKRFDQITTATGWQQYFVTFTPTVRYNMIAVYPQAVDLVHVGTNYIDFLYPQLIDVTNLATVTQTSTCNYSLQACAIANSTCQWFEGNGTSIGTGNPLTVNATVNPGPYTVTLSVSGLLTTPLNTCSGNITTITAQAFWNKATWVGGTFSNLTNWNIATNWSPAVIPDANTDVYIPVTLNQPVISPATTPAPQVQNLVMATGALLTNNDILKVAGKITGDPSSITNYDGSNLVGDIEMNGTCAAQTLAGNVFVTNDVRNFTTSNNVTISSTTGEGLDIWGELGFGAATGKTLNTGAATGDNITLVSTSNITANVAQIDATNFIDGKVTVERYINTGTVGTEHPKKWQMLATPTAGISYSPGQSVYNSWMEAGITPTTPNGYGTHIPDPRIDWLARGFDDAQGVFNTAIKTYNPISTLLVPIDNTGIPLYNKNGYFLFVRGDRTKTAIGDFPNPTILRSKGELFQPHTGYNPSGITIAGNGKFEMIGNPYASAIDIDYMRTHGKFSNLTNHVIVWDPLIPGTQGLGGYQVLSAPSYTPTPGGTTGNTHYVSGVSYPEIQSGQAFFMQTSGSSNGSVTFDESVKSSNSRLVTRGGISSKFKSFRATLFSSTGICDGNAIMFDNSFTNDVDANDAGRPFNPGENFMISKENSTLLTVEARANIIKTDSIFYAFKNLRKIKYQLVFAVENFAEEVLHSTLIDNYLHTKTALSLTDSSFVDFIVDDNKASYEKRFMVVFNREAKDIPLVANKNKQSADRLFVVYPNPTENKAINIQFENQPTGMYKLQLINYAGQVVFNSNIKITDTNGRISVKPGRIAAGNYQLVITAADGRKSVEQVIIK